MVDNHFEIDIWFDFLIWLFFLYTGIIYLFRLFYKLSVLWNNSCYLLLSNTSFLEVFLKVLSQTVQFVLNKKGKNLGQYDRPREFRCKPVNGVLVFLSSNQLYIATFVHQMGYVCVSHLVNKSGHIFIWFELRTNSTPSTGSRPTWSKYSRSVILAQILYLFVTETWSDYI